MSGNTRTMAFQIPEELFQRIKAHLERETQRTGRKYTQREFVLGLIEEALNEAERLAAEESSQTTGEANDSPCEAADPEEEDLPPEKLWSVTAAPCGPRKPQHNAPASQTPNAVFINDSILQSERLVLLSAGYGHLILRRAGDMERPFRARKSRQSPPFDKTVKRRGLFFGPAWKAAAFPCGHTAPVSSPDA